MGVNGRAGDFLREVPALATGSPREGLRGANEGDKFFAEAVGIVATRRLCPIGNVRQGCGAAVGRIAQDETEAGNSGGKFIRVAGVGEAAAGM